MEHGPQEGRIDRGVTRADAVSSSAQAGRMHVTWDPCDKRTNYPNVSSAPTLHLAWGPHRRRSLATLWLNPQETNGARRARDVLATGPRLDTAIWDVTWHTWSPDGTGLENAGSPDLASALDEVLVALLRQILIPDLRAREVQPLFDAVHRLSAGWRHSLPRPLRTLRWAYGG